MMGSTQRRLPVIAMLGAIACWAVPTASAETTMAAPTARPDGWAVATPADAGFDAAALVELTKSIKGGGFRNTHAVLIEHDGRLVYEAYFEGKDESWGSSLGHVAFDRDTLHDLRSVTKSVTSLLLGIALGGDYGAALDSPLVSFFPDLDGKFGKGLETVTLRHALTMTAGLEWNEMTVPYTDRNNDENRLYRTEDPVALVLARPVREPPGTKWSYNGGLTQVMAGLIERRTGKPLDKFAEEVLFGPLGIASYEWLRSRLWSRDSSPSAASGLRLRARDLAKIGSLVLHGGVWNGTRMVSADWIARSTERVVPDIPWGPPGMYGYGFMWYPGRSPTTPALKIVRASGNGDQRLFIVPGKKIAVTVFAGHYNIYDIAAGDRIFARIMAAHREAP